MRFNFKKASSLIYRDAQFFPRDFINLQQVILLTA